MPKYNKLRTKVVNSEDSYQDHFDRRVRDSITQYGSFHFGKGFQKKRYSVKKHIWSHGDKLYKLAHHYYGDIDMWWIIAFWNGRPTEAEYYYGLEIQIPFPVRDLYRELTNG